jgi:hypothetical protein
MSTVIAAVLMLGGPILFLVVVVGAVALMGLLAYDLIQARRAEPVLSYAEKVRRAKIRHEEAAVTRMYIERGVARGFVVLGAAFWGVSTLAASLWYERGMEALLFIALIPFLMNLASLIIGWRFERFASLMLTATAFGATYWAAVHNFELGVWMLFILLLIGPMLTAAVLFWLARQGEIDLAARLAPQAELVEAPAED